MEMLTKSKLENDETVSSRLYNKISKLQMHDTSDSLGPQVCMTVGETLNDCLKAEVVSLTYPYRSTWTLIRSSMTRFSLL